MNKAYVELCSSLLVFHKRMMRDQQCLPAAQLCREGQKGSV